MGMAHDNPLPTLYLRATYWERTDDESAAGMRKRDSRATLARSFSSFSHVFVLLARAVAKAVARTTCAGRAGPADGGGSMAYGSRHQATLTSADTVSAIPSPFGVTQNLGDLPAGCARQSGSPGHSHASRIHRASIGGLEHPMHDANDATRPPGNAQPSIFASFSSIDGCRSPPLKLSIVIVNFNNDRVLRGCLESLPAALSGLDAEVILSDNGSSDGSLEWIREHHPDIRIHENGANLGFAEANNRAFPLTRGDYVLLLNPDTIVEADAFAPMIELLDGKPEAGAVGCRLLNPDGSRQISTRCFPSLGTYTYEFLGLAFRYPGQPPLRQLLDDVLGRKRHPAGRLGRRARR